MKNNLIIHIFLPLLLLAGAAGCDDKITIQTGDLPDESTVGSISSAMRSDLSFSGVASFELQEGETEFVEADKICYKLSQKAASEKRAAISVSGENSPSFLAEVDRRNEEITAFNNSVFMGIRRKELLKPTVLPLSNIQIDGGNQLTVNSGEDASQTVTIKISSQNLSLDSLYELPLVIEYEKADGLAEKETFCYSINVRAKTEELADIDNPDLKITLDAKYLTVFYINTETYQPQLGNVFIYRKRNNSTRKIEEIRSIGNIINLRPATINYDALTKRAVFVPGSDLKYVLEHSSKYIQPLQDYGKKVCVCIENGGDGVGFCNMDDNQITDFTKQVKELVNYYKLDGINLRDDETKYGKEGMPAMTTSSYPKLIKALREALSGKLLTLEDKGTPTEYFYDTEKCGGIEIGKYIDYAWQGYADNDQNVEIVEPWETDNKYSDYTRKPIAGLDSKYYGSINIPYITGTNTNTIIPQKILTWKKDNRIKNNIIVFGNDLTANEQTKYEGNPMKIFSLIDCVSDDGSYWGPSTRPPYKEGRQRGPYTYSITQASKYYVNYRSGYKYLAKDW